MSVTNYFQTWNLNNHNTNTNTNNNNNNIDDDDDCSILRKPITAGGVIVPKVSNNERDLIAENDDQFNLFENDNDDQFGLRENENDDQFRLYDNEDITFDRPGDVTLVTIEGLREELEKLKKSKHTSMDDAKKLYENTLHLNPMLLATDIETDEYKKVLLEIGEFNTLIYQRNVRKVYEEMKQFKLKVKSQCKRLNISATEIETHNLGPIGKDFIRETFGEDKLLVHMQEDGTRIYDPDCEEYSKQVEKSCGATKRTLSDYFPSTNTNNNNKNTKTTTTPKQHIEHNHKKVKKRKVYQDPHEIHTERSLWSSLYHNKDQYGLGMYFILL